MVLLGVAAVVLAILFIIWTMPVGARIAERLGAPRFGAIRSGRPSPEDRDYLLWACGGDEAEVERRLAAERERFSDLGEADIYRRAIRKVMRSHADER